MDYSKIIGERLREERERLNMSQSDFALLASQHGVSGGTQRSVTRYEAGIQSPSVNFLSVVATVGVDVNYVLTGKPKDGISLAAAKDALEQALIQHMLKPESRMDAEALLMYAVYQSNGILARYDDGTPYVAGSEIKKNVRPKLGRPKKTDTTIE